MPQTQGERIMVIETQVKHISEQLKKIDIQESRERITAIETQVAHMNDKLENIDSKLEKIIEQLSEIRSEYVHKDDEAVFNRHIEKYIKDKRDSGNSWTSFFNNAIKLILTVSALLGALWFMKS